MSRGLSQPKVCTVSSDNHCATPGANVFGTLIFDFRSQDQFFDTTAKNSFFALLADNIRGLLSNVSLLCGNITGII
jgi:hypothetical protein